MCMIESSCDEIVDVRVEKFPKARKLHKCGECRRLIQIGEHYFYEEGFFEKSVWSSKTCEHCYEARKLIVDKCGGFVYTQVEEDLYDHTSIREWGRLAARYAIGIHRGWKKFKSDELMNVIPYEKEKAAI